MVVEPDTFKRVMRQHAGAVNIVTMCVDGDCHGLTVMDFCSVSLDPPLILVSIGNDLRSQALLEQGCCFAVNFLHGDQAPLSDRFAGRVPGVIDRLAGVATRTATTGAPILSDCLAWLDCRVVSALPAGDHTLYVAQVEAADTAGTGEPLLYYNGGYRRLS